jgi:hypothetical protein
MIPTARVHRAPPFVMKVRYVPVCAVREHRDHPSFPHSELPSMSSMSGRLISVQPRQSVSS